MSDERKSLLVALLNDARDYILNKAGRDDLNWRCGHQIIDRIDEAFVNNRVQARQRRQPGTRKIPRHHINNRDLLANFRTDESRGTVNGERGTQNVTRFPFRF